MLYYTGRDILYSLAGNSTQMINAFADYNQRPLYDANRQLIKTRNLKLVMKNLNQFLIYNEQGNKLYLLINSLFRDDIIVDIDTAFLSFLFWYITDGNWGY